MKKHSIKAFVLVLLLTVLGSCKKYLDVIPDNIATLDNAFTMRSEAIKYLYTCYSYMPRNGELTADPAMLSGDEMWALTDPGFPEFDHIMFTVARGRQVTANPVGEGSYWVNLYKGLRDCNIFLENVYKVPDLLPEERTQWIAEVTFLKAYYHFSLLRMYGPIPLVKTNLPVDVDVNTVKVYRDPVDSCFSYIARLLDECKDDLPPIVIDPTKELGRITQPIAYALKAKVMIAAASPLFNGNTDQASLKDNRGIQLFNQNVSSAKWDSAVVACKQAIDVCHAVNMKLYTYLPSFQQYTLTDTMVTQLGIRNVFTEKWNSEIIWANTQTSVSLLQRVATPNVDFTRIDNPRIVSELAPPLKMVELFYTDNGVPLNEDKTRTGSKTALRTAVPAEALYIRNGYTTAALHFNREPRFYANIGFDGGVWYGQGQYNDATPNNLFYVASRKGQPNGKIQPDKGSVTGYFIKKYVHFQNVQGTGVSDYSITSYPWPVIRLAQLYLWYAEALNEQTGGAEEAIVYLDKVRERAGLQGVKSSWDNFSITPGKYTTQNGLRDIIRQETMIEMAFEAQRYWDIRRWKTAIAEYRRPIEGWDIEQSDPQYFYRQKTLFTQTFGLKDYFFPINTENLLRNKNLVQNIGW
ncbi:RagB/SusD family nutrient uptake outer membrane protein [uncultured Chitinophaga sp.]|uniref:RagB/SusD family nutrient uptake outer membrane protein n=1 Tax=uncultured Chitinophaga sp. TaxID=339340 RepID=UPI0025CF31A6|nr:RagB/SusD family nutrient uptake outer membrane protein [uncultured Chitinophaga sp.]